MLNLLPPFSALPSGFVRACGDHSMSDLPQTSNNIVQKALAFACGQSGTVTVRLGTERLCHRMTGYGTG